jgi:hypothetical protein
MIDEIEQASREIRATIVGHRCVLASELNHPIVSVSKYAPGGVSDCESTRILEFPLRCDPPIFGPSHVCSCITVGARGLFRLLSIRESSLARAGLKISDLAAAAAAPPSHLHSR